MKYWMVVARSNLNSQYLLIYLVLKGVCFPKLEREESKPIMKRLFLQYSTQLPYLHKSSLNITIWKWSLPSSEFSESWIYTSFCSHHITLHDHYLCVCLIIFPLMVYKLLVPRPEYDSSLDPLKHLAHSLKSNYSWTKGQESCWVWPKKTRPLRKLGPEIDLIGNVWTTKLTGYTIII